MRHYNATELIHADHKLITVAARLGHAGGGTTTLRFYTARLSEADQRAAGPISTRMPARPTDGEAGERPPTPSLPSATDDALQPYQRIAADLRGAIDSGILRSGELLPSEKELATRYGVAASTAHRAVAVLVAAGVVKSSRGVRATVAGTDQPAPEDQRWRLSPSSRLSRCQLGRAGQVPVVSVTAAWRCNRRSPFVPNSDQRHDLLTTTRWRRTLLIMLDTPKRDRAAERREATRREILEAAWSLAQEEGLAEFALRDVAERVGMRAPSLYTHFESKHAIYDAMFGQAWSDYEQVALAELADLPPAPRAAVRRAARVFFDFAVANPARCQLMIQRTIPGFVPSPESYAPAVRVLERVRQLIRGMGLSDPADFEIWVAMLGGLVNQQLANDPGGTRWSALLDRAVDVWADGVGLPADLPAQSLQTANSPGPRRRTQATRSTS